MGVVGANKDTASSPQLLKPNEDIGLDVLHQMAQMNMAIGVRQSSRDEHAF
jgi:hypothetical protein